MKDAKEDNKSKQHESQIVLTYLSQPQTFELHKSYFLFCFKHPKNVLMQIQCTEFSIHNRSNAITPTKTGLVQTTGVMCALYNMWEAVSCVLLLFFNQSYMEDFALVTQSGVHVWHSLHELGGQWLSWHILKIQSSNYPDFRKSFTVCSDLSQPLREEHGKLN